MMGNFKQDQIKSSLIVNSSGQQDSKINITNSWLDQNQIMMKY